MKKQLYEPKADILVVDDKPENLRLLSTMLVDRGYEVRKAISGGLALKAALAIVPDLILLDINMPEISGYDVCTQLRHQTATQNVPIIFLSALNASIDKVKAFNCGGNDYIGKPFQTEEVYLRIANQLRIRSLQKQLEGQKAELERKNAILQQEIEARKLAEQELKCINQNLQFLATYDSLTRLANRYVFDRFLAQEWRRMRKEQKSLGIIMCDVDHFKLYNDHFGHQSGDRCLQQVAQAIAQVIRKPTDLAARYGGEEFALILPDTDANEVVMIAEKIRQQVEALNIPHPKSLVNNYVTLSFGVSCAVPNHQSSPEDLIQMSDLALYEAKQKGRNQVVLQSSSVINHHQSSITSETTI